MEVYCVSLKNCARRQRIKNQASDLSLTLKMWDAIDNRSSAIRGTMKAGAIGCYLSHYTLWQHLLLLEKDNYIIIEDDATLASNFVETVIKIRKRSDWGYVGLGGLECRESRYHDEMFNVPGMFVQTIGYMVTYNMLRLLHSTLHESFLKYHVDNEMWDRVLSLQKESHNNVFALNNHIVLNSDIKSEIN